MEEQPPAGEEPKPPEESPKPHEGEPRPPEEEPKPPEAAAPTPPPPSYQPQPPPGGGYQPPPPPPPPGGGYQPPPPPGYQPPPPPGGGYQPQPGAYQPPPPGYAVPGGMVSAGAPTDQMAIWAIVLAGLGLLGLCCVGVGGLILGPIAFFLGGSSLKRIRASNGAVGGDTLASIGRWGGLAVGILGLLILVFYVIAIANGFNNAITNNTTTP